MFTVTQAIRLLAFSWAASAIVAGCAPSEGESSGDDATTNNPPGTSTSEESTTSSGGDATAAESSGDAPAPTSTTEVDDTTSTSEGSSTTTGTTSNETTSTGTTSTDTTTDGGEVGEPCGGDLCSEAEQCVEFDGSPTCLALCHPFDAPCADSEVCVPAPGQLTRFVCYPDISGDAGAAGDACVYSNACDPGLVCAPGMFIPDCAGQFCCTPVCDTSAPGTCEELGLKCAPWYPPNSAPEGFEDLGGCVNY